jgi:hypothetical protein
VDQTYVQAAKALGDAGNAIEGGRYEDVGGLVTPAANELADRYLPMNIPVLDDTSLALDYASQLERDGNLELASTTRLSVLKNRMELYRRFVCAP